MLFHLKSWICSQLLNKEDNFAKKCLKIIRFHTKGVRCHAEMEFNPPFFSHSWTTQGPESTCWSGNYRCFTEIWPKMYMTYVRFWSNFEKTSVLHTFNSLSSPLFSYVNIFNINTKLLTQAFTWMSNIVCPVIDKCARELSVGILTPHSTYFSYFSVNSQNTFLSANFCMV